MIKLKEISKRTVSMFLTLAIITSMLLFFDIGKMNANAAVSKTSVSYPITFYVPETIYLKPPTGSGTTANTFQYYADCNTSGTLTAVNNDTSGQVYFYCAGATSCSISYSGASSVTMGTTSGSTTINTNITAGTLSSAINVGTTATITWTVTYTVGGHTRTAKAYT
ncbi:MAG: hypothetical protein GX824_05605, partial [Clostridiales bacterium]|nr:hypothetical protein [Clostridiales bacterium]